MILYWRMTVFSYRHFFIAQLADVNIRKLSVFQFIYKNTYILNKFLIQYFILYFS